MQTPNLGPQLDAVVLLFLILSWITVLLRCYVRIRIIKSFSVDDYLILITLVLFTTYAGMVFGGVHWGSGRHMEDLTLRQIENAMKLWYICELFYITSTTFLRLSAGYFLLRVAICQTHRHIIHTCNIMNVLFNIGFFFYAVFQCNPIDFWWTRFDGKHAGTCSAQASADLTYAQSALSALIDGTYGILPIFILWDLHLNTRKKILVGAILSLAAVYVTTTSVQSLPASNSK